MIKDRICPDCSKKHTSNISLCNQCKYQRRKKPCPECGDLICPEAKTCRKCRFQVGRRNGHWKGGKTRHSKGYFYVTRPNDHPGKAYYIPEHVLVMEKSIGRYLTDDETVHHKNGVRDDNRIGNLELWASNHPPGQRVEDIVKHAIYILEKYSPEVLK